MKDGFIRVCAATPDIRVADCAYNEKNIMNLMDEAYEKQVSVLVFPELCITGYTCVTMVAESTIVIIAYPRKASKAKALLFIKLPPRAFLFLLLSKDSFG